MHPSLSKLADQEKKTNHKSPAEVPEVVPELRAIIPSEVYIEVINNQCLFKNPNNIVMNSGQNVRVHIKKLKVKQ